MRTAFARALVDLAHDDDRVYLVIGDVGFGVFDEFAGRFPTRFINVGVAEANLAGFSAGLALSGKIVFAYSIGNFPVLRCLEQVRNDICYHNANVKIVSVGGGLAYGSLGASHHATEDLAVMRVLPGMTVIAPAGPIETELAIKAAYSHPGPVYVRLNRAGDPAVHASPPDFQIGRSIQLRDGRDVTLIACGSMVHAALNAAGLLADRGVSSRVLSMHTLKPLDRDAIARAARETGAIVTVEEHSLLGGLGSAVAEVLCEDPAISCRFVRFGLRDEFTHRVGSQEYLRGLQGLNAEGIADRIAAFLARTPSEAAVA